MGEYEPRDSRNVTLRQDRAPGEPPRTGPQEGETRRQMRQEQAGETELEQGELMEDGRGDDAEQVADPQAQQSLREAAMELDADELDPGFDSDRAGRLDRND